MEKLPRIVKNLDGDRALKFYIGETQGMIDIRGIHGALEAESNNPKGKTILLTSWGSIGCNHTLDVIQDFLYPQDEETG